MEQAHSRQNDGKWSAEGPRTSASFKQYRNQKSVMVWGVACTTSKTLLIFVEQGLKLTRTSNDAASSRPWYFCDPEELGQCEMDVSAGFHSGTQGENDSRVCQVHFMGFITSAEWAPYSSDLNPMDFSVWEILEARAFAKPQKILSPWSNRCTGSGTKSHRRSCGPSRKNWRGVWGTVSLPKKGTLKLLEYDSPKGLYWCSLVVIF